MKLDVYSDLRQSAAYASLLDDINRQFLTHADESVLKEASAALLHAKSFEELDEVTGEKLGQLQEETVAVLMACVRGRDVATQKLGDGVVTELINTVRRMEYLASITDVREMLEAVPSAQIASTKRKGKQPENVDAGAKLPVEVLLAMLNRGTSMDELEEELIVRVLKVLLFYFMWKVKALSEEDPKDITDVDVDNLHERRQEMVMAIARIISSRSVGEGKTDGMDAVRIAAAGTLLDVYTLFATLQSRIDCPKTTANGEEEAAEGTSAGAEALERLVAFSKEMPEELQSSVLKVFSKAERKFAKAAGRQLEDSPDNTSSDSDESESETSDNEEAEEEEEEEAESSTLLTYEQRLCEFSGKVVLAVLGDVVEKERFLKRVARNEKRLGKNFADVVAHLTLAAAVEEDHNAQKGGRKGVKVQKRGRGATEVSEEEVEEEGEVDMEDRIVVNKEEDGDDEQEHEHDDEEHEHAEEEDGGGEGREESEEHEHEDATVASEQEDHDHDQEEQEHDVKSPSPTRSPSLVLEDEDEEMVDA